MPSGGGGGSSTINDNIILGAYTFEVNPTKFSVNNLKLKTSIRSLNGTLQTTYVVADGGIDGEVPIKRQISISGISFEQLQLIKNEFKKASNLLFTDIYNESYIVQFDDFSHDTSADNVQYPDYTITLSEV